LLDVARDRQGQEEVDLSLLKAALDICIRQGRVSRPHHVETASGQGIGAGPCHDVAVVCGCDVLWCVGTCQAMEGLSVVLERRDRQGAKGTEDPLLLALALRAATRVKRGRYGKPLDMYTHRCVFPDHLMCRAPPHLIADCR
jgi:hypothetical protein